MAQSSDASSPTTKASSHYFAKAIPATEGGFTAQYGIPGLVPTRLKDPDTRKVVVYMSRDQAESEAATALIEVLNSRSMSLRGHDKPERYRKLTAAEFSVALDRTGMTPTFLAYLYGTDPSRVLKWIEGNEDIPHPIRVLLEIFTDYPETITLAERTTASVTTAIRPGGVTK